MTILLSWFICIFRIFRFYIFSSYMLTPTITQGHNMTSKWYNTKLNNNYFHLSTRMGYRQETNIWSISQHQLWIICFFLIFLNLCDVTGYSFQKFSEGSTFFVLRPFFLMMLCSLWMLVLVAWSPGLRFQAFK